MSRKKIVAGNWKMNTSFPVAVELIKAVTNSETASEVTKIFFPPFPFLKTASDVTSNSAEFFTGAQNCSEHDKGAYTGEVSASMIASVGCKYVLVGHSERRTFFKETNGQIVSKIQQVLQNKLIPVFCFGEQLAERKSNKHFETVTAQLTEVLKCFTAAQVTHFVLAYEPVWAIGTGETASPEQAQEMHAHVRGCLSEVFDSSLASQIPLLYGGSCNAQNAKDLFACKDVDGGLIGGASLKAEDFCKIINSF
ncbi:MAG: triose-phosphate isomerase [Bacteroidetes bacterium]|nr:triose-phosphate isomerase [Bacteroidota bacterium]